MSITPLCLSGVLVVSAALLPLSAAEKSRLPEGAGKATTERLCGTCHGANILLSKRESRDGWNGIVEDMIQRGAKGTDDEFGEVVDYCVAHFGKGVPMRVNVNEGSPKEISNGLGIPVAQGNAIVEFRRANGNFKTVEDLLKVPGIDAKAVEAKKASIEF